MLTGLQNLIRKGQLDGGVLLVPLHLSPIRIMRTNVYEPGTQCQVASVALMGESINIRLSYGMGM